MKMITNAPHRMGNYTKEISKDDDVYTVEDFAKAVDCHAFIDYDGFGYAAQDPKLFPWKDAGEMKMDKSIVIRPSTFAKDLPKDATHIVWYNR